MFAPPEMESEMSADLELLKNYSRTRDAQAFSALVSTYGDMVYATCLRILRNVADAEDATQECFLRLARDSAKVHTSLGAWLHRCATNECISRVRQSASSHRRERAYEAARQEEKQPSAWAEVSEHVDHALEELPDELRQVLVGHFLERKTQTQLAAELGVSPATMSRRINEGVEAIRKKLARAGIVVPVAVLSVMLLKQTAQAAPARLMAGLGKMAIAGPGASVGVGATGGSAGGGIGGSGMAAPSASAAAGTSGSLLSGKVLLSLAGAAFLALVLACIFVWNYARSAAPIGPAGIVAGAGDPGSAERAAGADAKAIAALSPEQRRIDELVYQLRLATPPDEPARWTATIQALARIGKPAVPTLTAELDATHRDGEQRLLMLALRMIGDVRAVPALIRAIPRLAPGSMPTDFSVNDPRTKQFLEQYAVTESPGKPYGLCSLDASISECTAALETLTNHSEGHEVISDGARSDDPVEIARDRQLREDFADRWSQWWTVHHAEFVTDKDMAPMADARIGLVDPVGLATFGPVFPLGNAITLGPIHEATIEAIGTWDARAYIDFDTPGDNVYTHNQGWQEPTGMQDTDWIAAAGVDAYARMTRPNDRAANQPLCMLQSRGMTTWRIPNERFDSLDTEIHNSRLLDVGPWGATDDLLPHDAQTDAPLYDEFPVTFLFTTREGGRGVLQIVGPAEDGQALQLRYRMFQGGPAVQSPPLAAMLHPQELPPASAGHLAFGSTHEVTLTAPDLKEQAAIALATGEMRSQIIATDDPTFTQSKRQWLASWGGDLLTLTWPNGQLCGLGGDHLLAMEVSPRAWHALSPDDLATYLARRDPTDADPLATFLIPNAHHQTPATWIIHTRSGDVGILQIAAIGNERLSLRYKLVKTVASSQ